MKTARELRKERGPETPQERNRSTGNERLGGNLRTLREIYGLGQSEVSEATGISAAYISQVETGSAMPTIAKLAVLVAFYEVSLDEIAGHMVEEARAGRE